MFFISYKNFMFLPFLNAFRRNKTKSIQHIDFIALGKCNGSYKNCKIIRKCYNVKETKFTIQISYFSLSTAGLNDFKTLIEVKIIKNLMLSN